MKGKEEFLTNKTYPEKLKPYVKSAMAYYSELKDTRIVFKFKSKIKKIHDAGPA